MNTKKKVGQAIKKQRLQKKKTQIEVAKSIGISRSYLSDIENGRYMPSVDTLIKLASYLDIDLNFLSRMTEIQDYW